MIPIARPSLGEEEAAAAREVILSGWVTQGPRVREFEDRFAAWTDANHACAVSSCTTALHLALLGVGVRPGEVVITVSHSFIATANAVRHCGAEPVFVDIDPETYNLDPADLARCLSEDCVRKNGHLHYRHLDGITTAESPLGRIDRPTGRVAAILAVHQMGMPCDLARITALARQYRLPLVEDAACAIGSEISLDNGTTWEKIGRPHGEAACFSFHPRKVLTTGDGGMLTTDNPELDRKFRLWRQHGMSVPDTVRHAARRIIFEEYITTGYNYRMTDIQAAVGIEQLKKLDRIIRQRRELAAGYAALFENLEWLSAPREPAWARTNWQSYPVRLRDSAPVGQTALMQALLDHGIATRRGIMNAHQEAPYREAGWRLPASEAGRDRVMLLPLYAGLKPGEQQKIAEVFKIFSL